MNEKLRAKKSTWKTEWSSGRTGTEVQVLHAMHFWRIYFAIKVERVISSFLKLLKNGWDSEKTINMKKFCIFRSFSRVYYLPHSDKVCRSYGENKFFSIFETDLKPYRIGRKQYIPKSFAFVQAFQRHIICYVRTYDQKIYRKYKLGRTCTVF